MRINKPQPHDKVCPQQPKKEDVLEGWRTGVVRQSFLGPEAYTGRSTCTHAHTKVQDGKWESDNGAGRMPPRR